MSSELPVSAEGHDEAAAEFAGEWEAPPEPEGNDVTEAPEQEVPQQLSSYEVVDRLTGGPDEAEVERRQQEAAMEDLRSGEAVAQLADEQAEFEGAIENLKARHPGIDNPEAIHAMQPIFDRVAEVYGETAHHPTVIAQIYEQVGGSEQFAPDPNAEAWESAIRPPGPPNAFRA